MKTCLGGKSVEFLAVDMFLKSYGSMFESGRRGRLQKGWMNAVNELLKVFQRRMLGYNCWLCEDIGINVVFKAPVLKLWDDLHGKKTGTAMRSSQRHIL